MARVSEQYSIAMSTFERIRAAFPALEMNLDLHHKHVELAMDIPAQPGLLFAVHLDLQNVDELSLSASALWVECFPCTNPKRVESYFDAVSGLLLGQIQNFGILAREQSRESKAAVPEQGRLGNHYRFLSLTVRALAAERT